ncbi:MAG TPA: hypothetical protein VFQ88_02990 [Nevskiaceae bacterium]|nr:hypothetical protein [Nevskiaceae bacterium]
MKKQTMNRTGKAGKVHFTTGMALSIPSAFPVSGMFVAGLAALFKGAATFSGLHSLDALAFVVVATFSVAAAFRLAADQDHRVRQ